MMNRLLKKLKHNEKFTPADFSETLTELDNPCRGWYRMVCFMLENEPDFGNIGNPADISENLIQVIINIGALNKQQLEEVHYKRIDRIIRFFAEKNKNIILRITYDHEGKADEREPAFFSQVLAHAEQAAEIMSRYPNEIFIFQGLLVGNWGEMHSSRYVTDERLRSLAAVMEKGCRDGQFLAVRTPVQWRIIRRLHSDGTDPSPRCIGLFNDGMFGSETDLGTYASGTREECGWSHPWGCEAETEFQGRLCSVVPNGGEALFDADSAGKFSWQQFTERMRKQHITYLNHEYDRRLLDHWKKMRCDEKGVWHGSSLYEYIGAHLGYRFIVRSAQLSALGSDEYRLEISIENTGFAGLYRSCSLYVEYTGNSGKTKKKLDYDLRDCKQGQSVTLSVVLAPETGEIFLYAVQCCDKRTVYFANADAADGRVKLGRIN